MTKQQIYRPGNYKGKNPMSRSQWRRQQRRSKDEREPIEKDIEESSTNQPQFNKEVEDKKPVGRKLFSPRMVTPEEKISEQPLKDDDMLTDDFDSGSESSMNINCNVVFVLPREYDQVTEVEESEEMDEAEMSKHLSLCYYVMNNDCIEEKNAFFERPDKGMKNHLKPLFIRGKVEDDGVNKILVYGGAIVNLMS